MRVARTELSGARPVIPPTELIRRIYIGLGSSFGKLEAGQGQGEEKWGKLTDDDLNVINGRRDQLEGKIQERYGYAKDQVRKDIDDWYGSQRW